MADPKKAPPPDPDEDEDGDDRLPPEAEAMTEDKLVTRDEVDQADPNVEG